MQLKIMIKNNETNPMFKNILLTLVLLRNNITHEKKKHLSVVTLKSMSGKCAFNILQ